jgi:hypothetical protein
VTCGWYRKLMRKVESSLLASEFPKDVSLNHSNLSPIGDGQKQRTRPLVPTGDPTKITNGNPGVTGDVRSYLRATIGISESGRYPSLLLFSGRGHVVEKKKLDFMQVAMV